MERKIGEIFEFGGEWYQCVESDSCGECSLFTTECGSGTKSDLADKIFGQCSRVRRSDNKHVIFKKLEKVGEPYEAFGKLFQPYKLSENIPIPIWDVNYFMCPHWKEGIVDIEIKQTKEDMEEKYKVEDTPFRRLVDKYVNNLIDYKTFEKAVKELYSDKEESKPVLKEFDLEAAKAGKPVCTRDGRKARIICFDSNNDPQRPIVALVEHNDNELLYEYTIEGKECFSHISTTGTNDLMMLPEKKEGWVNIYRSQIYNTLEKAKEAYKITGNDDNYLQTIKISWEE